MMKRTIQILAALLVIQLALTVFIFWPQDTAQAINGSLIPDFSAENVASLTILDGEDNTLTIAKVNDAWVLPEAGEFPINSEKVESLLEALAGVEANRLVTLTEASHKRLQVNQEDFNRLVEITMDDGTQHQLYIGSSAGVGATHIRLDDQPEVFLSEIEAFEANPQVSAWIDTLYQTVNIDEVIALTLENEQGTFAFEKEGDAWRMVNLAAEEVFDATKLDSLLNQAAAVRMTEPLGTVEAETYNLQAPQATLSLTTLINNEEKTYTLQIGAQIDNGYVVKSSESPYYVKINEISANNFLEKSQVDFLIAPPVEDIESTTVIPAEEE
jgi:hypothetical protein